MIRDSRKWYRKTLFFDFLELRERASRWENALFPESVDLSLLPTEAINIVIIGPTAVTTAESVLAPLHILVPIHINLKY